MLWVVGACSPAPIPDDSGTPPVIEDTSTVDPMPTDTGTPAPLDPDALSALGVVLGFDGSTISYAPGVQVYQIATPLFSDYAVKERAFALPEGTTAGYTASGVLDFPLGTVLVKSFLLPADLRVPTDELTLIETRVMFLEKDGWDTWPYLWNDEQTEAFKAPSGTVRPVTVTGFDGKPLTFPYLVPQRNQCVDCHERGKVEARHTVPIGPTARNLNVGGQLADFAAAGLLDGLPPDDQVDAATDALTLVGVDPTTLDDATLDSAARDYLDVNCAHCHNPLGTEGRSSQLFLNYDNDDAFNLGVCKKPGSAGAGTGGFTFDILPGVPEESILWFRLQTSVVGEMMPDIGRSLVHDDGVTLLAEWIRRIDGVCKADGS